MYKQDLQRRYMFLFSVLLPPSEDILTKTQIRQTRQAALMRDQLEDDNSDDIDVDFDIEAELTNIHQKENTIGDSLGSQILKNNEYDKMSSNVSQTK